MWSSATVALLGFVAGVAAQTTHTVVVGGPGALTFTPSCLWPAVGDIVNFEFHEKNHTATQSSFATPCQKLTDPGSFDSGFKPVAAGTTSGFPVMSFTVSDDKPKWFFCAQGNHCAAGMVFAVNPPREGNTFDAFLANAKNSANQATAPAPATTATPTASAGPDGVVTITSTVTIGSSVYTTGYPSSASAAPAAPTASTGPTVHLVTVGENGGLTYNPSSVKASPGDIVSFQFKSKNHTITQSSFADPCRKLEFTSTSGQIGFDSGFVPVSADASAFPTWNVTVNGTDPVWAYCRQANHCGNGMVFAINAADTGNKTFAAYQALAKQLNGTGSATPSGSSGSPSATSAPSVNGASQLILAGSWVGAVSALVMMFL